MIGGRGVQTRAPRPFCILEPGPEGLRFWSVNVGRRATRGLYLVAAAFLSGCHTYVPTDLPSVSVGQEVRVYLSRAAVSTLPEEVPVNSLYITGRLMERETDSLTLGIRMGPQEPGIVMQDLRQMVRVGTGQVVDVRERQFSAPRTAILAVGAAGAAAFLINMIFGAEDSDDPGDPDEEFSRVPVVSFPLRLPLPGR